mmetsp:Transcript_936/g.1315  ORF Transcript_936/g.1315 Transcript_936/m.1315 type:complete len:217 (+) Transcript_936:1132-1782(+)
MAFIFAWIAAISFGSIATSPCTLAQAVFSSEITLSTAALYLSLFFGSFSTVSYIDWTFDSSILSSANALARAACVRRAKNILTTFCITIAASPRAAIFELNFSAATMAHATFFHRCFTSHSRTFATSFTRFSGSAFMMVSNSANFPGRKKTFETPNWKSSSLRPRALKRAFANVRGSSLASSGGRTDLYMSYKSLNAVRDGNPPCIRSITVTIPAH